MKHSPISMRHAFDFAWPTLKRRFGLFTAVLLTILAAWVVLEIVVIAGQRFGIVLWAVMHLAFLIFVAGVELGLLQICRALRDGKVPAFADTVAHLPLGPKLSALLSKGATTGLPWTLAALVVLNVLGASLLGLGLFITVPLSVLIMTDVYRQLTTPPPTSAI